MPLKTEPPPQIRTPQATRERASRGRRAPHQVEQGGAARRRGEGFSGGRRAHEWARLAALQRDPPKRQVIPELNRDAWLEMARLMATLNGAVWRFQPGKEGALREAVEAVRGELAEVRNLLIGGPA